jgi:glycosyltransferase involved in cell wall biosynthesis
MPEAPAAAPWVIVAAGLHHRGGMEKANLALAEHLLERGTPVHLVTYAVDEEFARRPGVRVRRVPLPAGSFHLGEYLLDRAGRQVARSVTARWPGARVVVNGGNCGWPDINWVHAVHRAWPCADEGAPAWFRAKNRLMKRSAVRREALALRGAWLVVANSGLTRGQLLEHHGLDPERVRTVYLGTDPGWAEPDPAERAAARERLGVAPGRPLVVFVGALGHDNNKGLDTLWDAWRSLCAAPGWDAELAVAGGGRGVPGWRARVAAEGLEGRVRILGFTDRVRDLLGAADLLVSPSRYEAYGLNVHEAVCRGVPALVSGRAGVAERYPPELREMVLPDPEDSADLAARLRRWAAAREDWKARFRPLGERMRGRGWPDMAAEIVGLADSSLDRNPPPT